MKHLQMMKKSMQMQPLKQILRLKTQIQKMRPLKKMSLRKKPRKKQHQTIPQESW